MKTQQGFTLVTAIFILVVVGLLGSYMVRMSGNTLNTSSYALQGARAYLMARSGIEWSMVKITSGTNCAGIDGQSYTLNGFTVSLTCTSQSFTEGATTYSVYSVSALSQYGSYGSSGYVARSVKATVTQ